METGSEENRQKPVWSQDGHIWEAAEVWSIIPSCRPLKMLLCERAPWAPRSHRDKHDPNPFIYSFSLVRVERRRGCCEPIHNTGSHIRRHLNVVSYILSCGNISFQIFVDIAWQLYKEMHFFLNVCQSVFLWFIICQTLWRNSRWSVLLWNSLMTHLFSNLHLWVQQGKHAI